MNVRSRFTIARRSFLGLLGAWAAFGVRTVARAVAPAIKVTLPEAHKGTLEVDTRLLDSYGEPPETLRSFYLEARAAFAGNRDADFKDAAIVQAARDRGLVLMGGPLLGDLREDRVSVWLRPAVADDLEIRVLETRRRTAKVYRVRSRGAGVAQRIVLDGLLSNTDYRYDVVFEGRSQALGSFTTPPPASNTQPFRLAFGSCCHKIGIHNRFLFGEVRKRQPHAMMILGDSAVDDRENRINMHRADYQLRDVSAAWRDLVAHVPVYASWDDHDYFNNDLNGIPRRFNAADREAVRAVWRENWNNPEAEDGREGIYFSSRVGPVEIIMLDTRSCRDNARRNQHGSYLGEKQMVWLKETLAKSTAPFKVISSGTMWSDYVSKAKDSWGSWDIAAREELFGFIEQGRIGGVLLISGDRHGARAFRIPRPSGFTFHEFEAATLGGVPGPAGLVKNCPEQLFGYDGKDFIAFGEFTFEMGKDDPTVTFRLIDQAGQVREEHALTQQTLTPRA